MGKQTSIQKIWQKVTNKLESDKPEIAIHRGRNTWKIKMGKYTQLH